MRFSLKILCGLSLVSLLACSGAGSDLPVASEANAPSTASSAAHLLPKAAIFYAGADLSYVNEMLDCGAEFRHQGQVHDPYQLFAEAGTQLVRLRLWHNPDWTRYSHFDDVVSSIER